MRRSITRTTILMKFDSPPLLKLSHDMYHFLYYLHIDSIIEIVKIIEFDNSFFSFCFVDIVFFANVCINFKYWFLLIKYRSFAFISSSKPTSRL